MGTLDESRAASAKRIEHPLGGSNIKNIEYCPCNLRIEFPLIFMQTMRGISRSLSVLAELSGFFKFGLNCPGVPPPIHISGKIGELAGRSGIDIVVEFYSTVYRMRGRCLQERGDFP